MRIFPSLEVGYLFKTFLSYYKTEYSFQYIKHVCQIFSKISQFHCTSITVLLKCRLHISVSHSYTWPKCEHNFRIGNEVIDVVQNYTYLGTRITSSGNFTLSLEHLRQKALHALFSLRRHTDLNGLKPSLACKIFDSMISPILTYNSEVWGAFVKSDFKSWDSSATENPFAILWTLFTST